MSRWMQFNVTAPSFCKGRLNRWSVSPPNPVLQQAAGRDSLPGCVGSVAPIAAELGRYSSRTVPRYQVKLIFSTRPTLGSSIATPRSASGSPIARRSGLFFVTFFDARPRLRVGLPKKRLPRWQICAGYDLGSIACNTAVRGQRSRVSDWHACPQGGPSMAHYAVPGDVIRLTAPRGWPGRRIRLLGDSVTRGVHRDRMSVTGGSVATVYPPLTTASALLLLRNPDAQSGVWATRRPSVRTVFVSVFDARPR
jgi:hypothetical protein